MTESHGSISLPPNALSSIPFLRVWQPLVSLTPPKFCPFQAALQLATYTGSLCHFTTPSPGSVRPRGLAGAAASALSSLPLSLASCVHSMQPPETGHVPPLLRTPPHPSLFCLEAVQGHSPTPHPAPLPTGLCSSPCPSASRPLHRLSLLLLPQTPS